MADNRNSDPLYDYLRQNMYPLSPYYFRELGVLIPDPGYCYLGRLTSAEHLPPGFNVYYSNAKYPPIVEGSTDKVVIDFGNGKLTLYPAGMACPSEIDQLTLSVFFNGKSLK